jgi:hypothetical protein
MAASTAERQRDTKGRFTKEPSSTRPGRRADPPVELARDEHDAPILFADLAEHGYRSNRVIAEHLGCGEATISRLRSGDQKPGLAFIACVASRYPHELHRYFDFAPKAAA